MPVRRIGSARTCGALRAPSSSGEPAAGQGAAPPVRHLLVRQHPGVEVGDEVVGGRLGALAMAPLGRHGTRTDRSPERDRGAPEGASDAQRSGCDERQGVKPVVGALLKSWKVLKAIRYTATASTTPA